jgi:transcriptional regulator with XRE-family HTH domain
MSTKKGEIGKKSKRAIFDPEFGKRLREAFNSAKNKDIAAQSGISEGSISKYVNGRVPDPPELMRLADISGRSIHWLLTGKGPEKVEDLEAAAGRVDLDVVRDKAIQKFLIDTMLRLKKQKASESEISKVG